MKTMQPLMKSNNDTTNSTSNSTEIPSHLTEEWESYLAACESLDVEPNARRFIRYNELYPNEN